MRITKDGAFSYGSFPHLLSHESISFNHLKASSVRGVCVTCDYYVYLLDIVLTRSKLSVTAKFLDLAAEQRVRRVKIGEVVADIVGAVGC
jgi:hypothetical protein